MKAKRSSTRFLACLLVAVMIVGLVPNVFGVPVLQDRKFKITAPKGVYFTEVGTLSFYSYDCVEASCTHNHTTFKVEDYSDPDDVQHHSEQPEISINTKNNASFSMGIYVDYQMAGEDNLSKELSFTAGGKPVNVEVTNTNNDIPGVTLYDCTFNYVGTDPIMISFVTPQVAVTLAPTNPSNQYTLTTGEDLMQPLTSKTMVNVDGDFKFKLKFNSPQYAYYTPTVTAQDEDGNPVTVTPDVEGTDKANDTYVYSIGIKKACTIYISTEKFALVTLSTGENYTIERDTENSSNKVRLGDNFSFTVKAKPGYKISSVRANGDPITDNVGEKYTLKSLHEDTTVTVETAVETHTVTFENGCDTNEKYVVSKPPMSTVEYDRSYTFTVTPNAGFEAPTVQIKMGKGDAHVSTTTDTATKAKTYTINNITDEVKITIGEPDTVKQNISFSVSGVDAEAYELKNESDSPIKDLHDTVEYDQEYKFKIVLKDGYNQTKPTVTMRSTATGRTTTIEPYDSHDDTYTYNLNNVTADTTVTISGIRKNTYSVKYPENAEQQKKGYTLTPNNTTVEHNGTVSFTVRAQTGYNVTNVTAKYTDEKHPELALSPEQSGDLWTIKDVQGPIEITVECSQIKLDITPPDKAGEDQQYETPEYSLKSASGDEFNLKDVGYGEAVTFQVVPKDGYEIQSVRAVSTTSSKVMDTKTIGTNSEKSKDNYYETWQISNITENIRIEVTTQPVRYTITFIDKKATSTVRAVSTQETVTFEATDLGDSGKLSGEEGQKKLSGHKLASVMNEKNAPCYDAYWTDASGKRYSDEQVAALELHHQNVDLVLTANYDIQWNNVYQLELTCSWDSPKENNYTLRLTTKLGGLDATQVEELKFAEINGFGVFFTTTPGAIRNNEGSLVSWLTSNMPQDFNSWGSVPDVGGVKGVTALNATPFTSLNKGVWSFSYSMVGYDSTTASQASGECRAWIVFTYQNQRQYIMSGIETIQPYPVSGDPAEELPSMDEVIHSDLEVFDGGLEDLSAAGGLELQPSVPEIPVEPAPIDPLPAEPMPIVEAEVEA